ncbi:MAG TPA: M28 family peptidase [candidate division Zixibacteria bacterium]|nr:M28 family peptidase [candidate division Zixibacteria bacterium]
MRTLYSAVLAFFLFSQAVAFGATEPRLDFDPNAIYKHISVLADDSLEGREVGEPGEWKAAMYLIDQFRQFGLEPRGEGIPDQPYLQPFEFVKSIDLGDNNHLTVNGTALEPGEEFSPMRQSASTEFDFDQVINVGYGIAVDSVDGDYDDYAGLDVAGKAVVIKRYSPVDSLYPDIPFERYSSLTSKISTAIDHDAAAVLFITPGDQDDTLTTIAPTRVQPKEIPIVFLRRKALERLGLDIDHPTVTGISGSTELIKVHDTGYNVVGYLPGETDTTIIIGAHYDHLGYGGPSSRYLGPEKLIHNGADDNGSGTSAMLELARYFTQHPGAMHHSLLFIAFSGEEAGILGSSHFARDMTIDSSLVKMMINLDMIGRLKDQDGLAVMGIGTASEFKEYFDNFKTDRLNLMTKESGVGPSDHTAFYNRHIPVLFFFTGAHADYHKPSDDIDKIDTQGIAEVCQLVTEIVHHFDEHRGALTYQKTKSDQPGHSYSEYSVTLGIMPDFVGEVEGLRVDGVSPGRPGERAGLLEGDIIVKMGSIEIGDIYDYMNALGKFRKGDSTRVTVERGDQTIELNVLFE